MANMSHVEQESIFRLYLGPTLDAKKGYYFKKNFDRFML